MTAAGLRKYAPLAAALVLAVPCIVVTCMATERASFEPFGRDQGIFQYVGWALSRGQRDYVDVRDFNGPLVPLIHVFFLALGGADEHVFRCLDLAAFAVASLFVGAVLPGAFASRREGSGRGLAVATRAAWAVATWVVLSSGYLLFDWWSHAQRESFFDDLVLPAIGLQLWAHGAGVRPRTRRTLLVAAGFVGTLTWFGKPSCLVYGVLQALVILVDDELPGNKRAHLGAFAAGCIAGCLAMLVALAAVGDPVACVRNMFEVVARLHRYIWHKSLVESYYAWNNPPKIHYILATLVAAVVAVATRVLPRRILATVVLIVGGIVNFVAQGKGFPYHLQSAIAGVHLFWVASAAVFAERMAAGRYGVGGLSAVAAGLGLLVYQVITETSLSPAMVNDWYAARRAAGPESEAFLSHFTGGDYFAWDIHRAGAYLREHTAPNDRVQTYGMDPYVMFLAQRLSATPYIYNFELNVDSALEGHPSDADREWMLEAAQHNARDLFERMQRDPPAAFVSMDRVPYTFPKDADAEFAAHCPDAGRFIEANYRLAERFGTVRVWLRGRGPVSP